MTNRIILVILSFLYAGPLVAQKRNSTAAKAISSSTTDSGTIYYGNTSEPPRAIEFKEGTVSSPEFIANILSYFNIPPEYSFAETESTTDQLGIRHRFLQQYYKGIVIEGMGYRVHEKNGFVKSANGKAVRTINIDLQTTLSESQAFQNAVRALNTKDTTIQQGKKLIVSKDFTFTSESFSIAYLFDIDVSLIERWRISIDARTGQVINKVSLVQNCFTEKENESPPLPYGTGTGLTTYYGTQTIRVEKFDDGSSRLIGQTENNGMIETYSFNNASIFAWIFGFNVPMYSIYSPTNVYNDPYQKNAVSVQWAAEQAYEYYFKNHNRNSYDNLGSSVRSVVHVDVGLNNAFWSRNTLLFGDGSNNNPLVELDVVGHELTHGVTQYEAQLQYYGESGALNESFSDIFGKAIEFSTFGDTATWQLSKFYRAGGLRDFSNPNLKNQPDTWLGDMWYTGYDDNGGVHYNSGVQNFWYYLLCVGGNGVNDNEENYTVNAIGMEAASKIAYRNLTEYLSYYSDYLDSRIGSLLATADLYGKNSTVYQQVNNAWDAVGVIDEPIITNLTLFDITATTVKIKGTLVPRGSTVNYFFEYGPTPAYGSSSPSYQYIDKVEGLLTGLQSQTHYFVRLVATNENGSSYSTKEFTTISLAPLVKIKQTVDVTETTAMLYGQINPNSLATSFYFQYGPTPAFGSVTPTFLLSDTTEFINVAVSVSNLLQRQTYYYRLVATNTFTTSTSETLHFFTSLKPTVASFLPVAAMVGSEVTINGENFNPEAAKNAVNFGATRAKILSGTTTQLKVEVPAGASFGPVTVLDTQSGLVAQSVREFVPTFSGEFKKGYLQLRMGINDLNIYKTKVQDMDGDNKPDIVALHYPGFSVLQNVNQGGDITNESFVRNTYNTEYSSNLWLVDIDGNGLKDVVLAYQNGLRIYPNLSVPGFVFFGPSIDLFTGIYQIVFNDFDQDGRIDIAGISVGLFDNNKIVFIRNQNPKGSILVANFKRQVIDLTFYATKLNSFDVTNDGKLDAIVSSSSDPGYFTLLKNNSQPGEFNFEPTQINNPTIRRNEAYSAYDLNQDGWKDFISYKFYEIENVIVSENNGNASNINFASQTTAIERQNISDITAGDINGDSKVDLIVDTGNRTSIFLKNNTEAGEHFSSTSFENYDKFGMFVGIVGNKYVDTNFSLNDLNGDGRPEVIAAYSYYYGPHDGYQMEIWQNAPASCIDPTSVQFEVYSSSVTIVLPINTTLDQFQIEYSLTGTNDWYPVSSKTFGVLIGASYQIRVRAKCYLGYSDFYYKTIVTDCVNTSYFNLNNITANSVNLQPNDISSFEVQYSLLGLNQWITLPLFVNQITNLFPGTTYDIRFRGRCNYPADFNYRKFTTLCPKLSSLTINDIRPNSAVVNWTSNYVGFAILEYSIDNTNWTLIDFNRIMSPLIPAKTYYVRGRFHCNNIESEFAYTSFTTPCPKVSNINIKMTSPFSTEINWLDASNTGSYTLSYSLTSGGVINTIQTNSTSVTLNGLSPGGSYTVWIAPFCTSTKDFTSVNFATTCFTPFNLTTHEISYKTAKLTWSDSFSGVPYSVDYSIAGSGNWQTITSSETTQLLEELRPATKYEVRVHISCPSVKPDYASIIFETNAYGETSIAPNPTDKSITLFPSKNLIGNFFGIYDNSGKLIVSGQLLNYTFDLSLLSPGFYTLKIDGEKPLKIIKR